jgi:hypothetical protein
MAILTPANAGRRRDADALVLLIRAHVFAAARIQFLKT